MARSTMPSPLRESDRKKAKSPWPIFGTLAVLGAVAGVAVAGSSGKATKDPNANQPDPGPRPDKPPTPAEDIPPANIPPGESLNRFPGLEMIDLRAKAPKDQILRMRTLEEVTAVVIHQTSFFGWKDTNPLWPKIKSHFVVRRDGRVQINYDPEVRMTTGSNSANKFCVTIEHEGNYPNSNGNFYKPEKFGRSYLADAPNQVAASRKLIAALHSFCPKMTAIFAHTQWAADRANCPGPDLWLAIGEWGLQNLNLTDGGPGWHYEGGHPIPGSWRGEFV